MLARKIFLLITYIAMVVGGTYVIAAECMWAQIIYGRFVIGAAVLVTMGVYLLWEDFIAPLLRAVGKR